METKKNTKRDTIKAVVAMIAGAGAWEVLSNAIKSTTPSGLGFMAKLGVTVGTFVLGDMLSSKVTEYTDNSVDQVIDTVSKFTESEPDEPFEEEVG